MKNNQHLFTRAIHWSMAILTITIIVMGFYMAYVHDLALYPLHKSLGVIAFVFILFRLYARLKNPWQSSSLGSSQEKLVHIVHWLLLGLLLLMPISGMLNSGFGGYGISLFGLEIIPSNFDPSGKVIAFNGAIANLGKRLHEINGYIFSAFILLHVGAALKHHFIDKDDTLNRMLNRQSTERRASN
ncbi:cytochrome b [Colwelliaceae bacterium 6441]